MELSNIKKNYFYNENNWLVISPRVIILNQNYLSCGTNLDKQLNNYDVTC